ncbi:MAG: hypothetical protein K6U78_13175 [Anaerolineae bacterium]|jgi:hypothetical protein|nr:hypothetical protein [Anaerolineae bacterium]
MFIVFPSPVLKERNLTNNRPIDLTVGGSAPRGMIKFDQARFGGDGAVTLRASANASEGLIEVARSNISACHRPVDGATS